MNFEWDEIKNRANIKKHGFDLADAEEMFRGAIHVRPDIREDYGEWIGIGMIQGRLAFLAFAECGEDTIRIIPLRKAEHEERKEYEAAVHDGLETD